VLGGLDSHDDICAELAERAGVAVVGVQYRLAPEHRFPAAFEDCRAVRDWIAAEGAQQGLRTHGLLLAGDSAGGSLAAALAIDARDRGGPQIGGQILIYPGLGGDMSKGSYLEHAEAPGLSTEDVRYYHTLYAPAAAQDNKLAHPLRETDYRGLAPTFLIAAEWDPLRDDCYAYAERLGSTGVPALVRHEPLLVHAFLRARHMSRPAAESFTAIVDGVRSLAFYGRLPPHP
jgi:acetyl esterase